MGIDELIEKGKDFIEDNGAKLQDLLKTEQAESVSDSILDAGSNLAKQLAPDELDGKIDGIRAGADGAVGNE